VVDGVKGCRNIEEAETGDLLMAETSSLYKEVRSVLVECCLVKPDRCGLRCELEVM